MFCINKYSAVKYFTVRLHQMTDIYNCNSENIEDAATIEHYFAIKAGQSDNIDLLKLSHKRCNK